MSRLVRIKSGQINGDDYIERVAKYVPVEIVAAYLALNKLIDPKAGDSKENWYWSVSFFVFCWVLTPIYVWVVRKAGDAWKIHAVVSFFAFLVWALAIGGNLTEHGFLASLPPFVPSASLIIFTLLAGLVRPRPNALAP